MKTLPDIYPGRAEAPSTAYPEGSFKNETIEGSDDGTPVENQWANQTEAFFQALDERGGIDPGGNGTVDTALVCQRMMAFRLMNNGTTRPPHAYREDICSGLLSQQWQAPGDDPNFLSVGHNVVDSCVGWSYPKDKPVLFLACDDNAVRWIDEPWDYNDHLNLGAPLGLSYYATPSNVLGVCSDARYLYVVYRVASDDSLRVSKYDIQNFTGSYIWDVALGETVPDDDDVEYVKIIVASGATVAVSIPRPIGTNGVAIIAKTTGAIAKGNGNNTAYTIAGSRTHYGKIVSDGYHVFWIGKAGTSTLTFYLASAKITNPTTSDYSLNTLASGVSDSDAHKHFKGLLNVGGPNGVVLVHNADGEINQFRKLDNASSGTRKITPFSRYPMTVHGEYSLMSGHDGMNAWFHLVGYDVAKDEPVATICKVPLGWFGRRGGKAGVDNYDDIIPDRVYLDWWGLSVDGPIGRLLFDGRDMWACFRGGVLHRICNPMAR